MAVPTPNDPWIVEAKGCVGSRSFEISVIRTSNVHGRKSYGWFDKDKLLITHNGGPCDCPLSQRVWDKMLRVAQEVADEMNDEDRKEPLRLPDVDAT